MMRIATSNTPKDVAVIDSDDRMENNGEGTTVEHVVVANDHDVQEEEDEMMMAMEMMVEEDEGVEEEMMMKAFLDEADIVDEGTEHALETIVGLNRQVSDATTTSVYTNHSSVSSLCISFTANKNKRNTKNSNSNSNGSLPPPGYTNYMSTEMPLGLTLRPAIRLYLSCNPDFLSSYQCLLRKNIEFFEANECDVTSRVRGRNKAIVLGQVGIRCCFCSHIAPADRDRGSMYFPSNLLLIYQAAQILSQDHLMGLCQFVPPDVRDQLTTLRQQKSHVPTVGKEYWAKTAQVLGLYEDQFGLRFEKKLGFVQH